MDAITFNNILIYKIFGLHLHKKGALTTILFTLLLIGSAIAVPKENPPKQEKTPFTSRIILAAGVTSQGEQTITETGILYVIDAISTGYIETDPDSPISGSIWTILSGSLDLSTMLGSFNGKWIITNEWGTFEGSVVGIVEIAAVSGRFVGHGTENFERQKIMGSFEGTVNNYIVDLTLQGILTSK